MKSKKLLNDFTKYCTKHPELRFWQALCAWSGAKAIIYSGNYKVKEPFVPGGLYPEGVYIENFEDTFYWETKNGKRKGK